MKRRPVFYRDQSSQKISACTAHTMTFFASQLLSCFWCESQIHEWFFISDTPREDAKSDEEVYLERPKSVCRKTELMRGTGLPHEFTSKKIMAKLRLKVPGTWAGECEKKMGLNNKAEIELTIS